MDYDLFLQSAPYEAKKEKKHLELTEILRELTVHHQNCCPEYAKILSTFGYHTSADVNTIASYENIPFIPVRMFKESQLKSVSNTEVVKTMTSSGTSGQQVSQIYLDRETSANQSKIMTQIVSDFLGKQRLPMIILDTKAILKNRAMFSARGAGILGFSMFGRDRIYALDENMTLDVEGLKGFLEKHKGENVFLFGFTYIIWQHFYKRLLELSKNERPDLSRGILIHGGGWKKLENSAVSPEQFKNSLYDVCGLKPQHVYNYYGMVEQTGTVYMECEHGHLHTSIYSDVIIRNPEDWSVQPNGEKGIIEVVSALPKSYPGHILLTEDEGIIQGEDDCPCGRKGKYFKVLGRVKNAEIRGCSDTYAETFSINHNLSVTGTSAFSRNGLTVLCGDVENLNYKPLAPFNSSVLEFLANVGQYLLQNKDAKAYPDIITFGFFCRKANIVRLSKSFMNNSHNRVGRGLVFHIAPSNVPINFAYSLISGLLAGNACIVKTSSKNFEQTRIVCAAFNKVLKQEQFSFLIPYINVVQYERDRQDLTKYFSSICNARIIWGGDATIETIKNVSIPPRSIDIAFADRYSIAVFDVNAILKIENDQALLKTLAQDFYNDTYLYDQNACSSPKLLYWLGEKDTDRNPSKSVRKAQSLLWKAVYDNIKDRYKVEPVIAVNKQMAVCRTAVAIEGSTISNCPDNRIVRVRIPYLVKSIPKLHSAGGFYHEYADTNLEALAGIVDEKYQTLAYYGCDPNSVKKFVISHGLHGIDRIVPVGHTADYGMVWDGYDLITTMSREIVTM